MKTLYYIRAGMRFFAFYLDRGRLTVPNRGVAFLSFGAVLVWASEHNFDLVANCEPESSLRVAPNATQSGGPS